MTHISSPILLRLDTQEMEEKGEDGRVAGSEGGQNEVTPEVAPKLGNCERCTVSFFTSSPSPSLSEDQFCRSLSLSLAEKGCKRGGGGE